MEITNTIAEGQWFCAVEGIAIAEKSVMYIMRNMIAYLKTKIWAT